MCTLKKSQSACIAQVHRTHQKLSQENTEHESTEVRHSHTEAATEYFVETCAYYIINTFSINLTIYLWPQSGTSFLTLTAKRPREAFVPDTPMGRYDDPQLSCRAL